MPNSLLSGLPDAQQQILQQGFLEGLRQAEAQRQQQAQAEAQKQEQQSRQDFAVQQQQAEWQHQAEVAEKEHTQAAADLAKQNGVEYYKNKLATYGQEVDALYNNAAEYTNDADYSDNYRKNARGVMDWAQKKKIGLSNVNTTTFDPTQGIPALSEPLPTLGTPEFTPEYLKSVSDKSDLPALQAANLRAGIADKYSAISHRKTMEGIAQQKLSGTAGLGPKDLNIISHANGIYGVMSNLAPQVPANPAGGFMAAHPGMFAGDFITDPQTALDAGLDAPDSKTQQTIDGLMKGGSNYIAALSGILTNPQKVGVPAATYGQQLLNKSGLSSHPNAVTLNRAKRWLDHDAITLKDPNAVRLKQILDENPGPVGNPQYTEGQQDDTGAVNDD